MPKNKIGGKAHKKRANKNEDTYKKMIYPDQSGFQQFAISTKILGGRMLLCKTLSSNDDYISRILLCHIRGKMRKRAWINVGDLILISYRSNDDFNKDMAKVDSIHKYDGEDVKTLIKLGYINSDIYNKINSDLNIQSNKNKSSENLTQIEIIDDNDNDCMTFEDNDYELRKDRSNKNSDAGTIVSVDYLSEYNGENISYHNKYDKDYDDTDDNDEDDE